MIKSNGTSRFGSSSSSADTGKNVAKNSILANCVIIYITPAVTHFQKAPYSDLKLVKIHVIDICVKIDGCFFVSENLNKLFTYKPEYL